MSEFPANTEQELPSEHIFSAMSCLNCGLLHSEKYCSRCAQPAMVLRIRWSNMFNELKERIWGLDGRFFRSFRMAFVNPGEMAREYIAGNRVKYIGPVGIFLICITVYLLLLSAMGIEMSELIESGSQFADDDTINQMEPAQRAMMETMYTYFNNNFRTIGFFSVVVVGLLIWIFNRRMKLNLAEQMVFPLYTEGLAYFISLPQLFLWKTAFFPTISLSVLFISQIFLVYAYTTFDRRGSVLRSVIKGISIRIFSIIISGLIAVIFTLVWLVQHKELFESTQ